MLVQNSHPILTCVNSSGVKSNSAVTKHVTSANLAIVHCLYHHCPTEINRQTHFCAMSLQALEEGGSGSSYVNMLWLLLRLRQACNHPWLVQGTSAKYGGPGACSSPVAPGSHSTGGKVSASQLSAAKKLAGPLVEQLLQTLEQQPSICAQCEDISEDSVVSACHHVFCRQCIIMQVSLMCPCHCKLWMTVLSVHHKLLLD